MSLILILIIVMVILVTVVNLKGRCSTPEDNGKKSDDSVVSERHRLPSGCFYSQSNVEHWRPGAEAVRLCYNSCMATGLVVNKKIYVWK